MLLVESMFNTIASFDEARTKAAGFAQEPHFRFRLYTIGVDDEAKLTANYGR